MTELTLVTKKYVYYGCVCVYNMCGTTHGRRGIKYYMSTVLWEW